MAIDEPGYTVEDPYAAFEITAPFSQSNARIAMTAAVAQRASPGGYVVQFTMPLA